MKPRLRLWLTRELLIILVALGLLIYGLSYFWQRQISLAPTALPPATATVKSSTARPSEATVTVKTTAYNVAPDMPKLLVIAPIGVQAFIQKVAIDTTTNEMAVPTNIHLAGWYTGSVKPGDNGLSIIDGHVQGYYAPGIFQHLAQLKPGTQLYIQYGDGSSRTFAVVSNHNYAVNDVPQALFAKDPSIQSQLNLITCGGSYDKTQHQYTERTLVVTKRIN